jgi:hypothetical protein
MVKQSYQKWVMSQYEGDDFIFFRAFFGVSASFSIAVAAIRMQTQTPPPASRNFTHHAHHHPMSKKQGTVRYPRYSDT